MTIPAPQEICLCLAETERPVTQTAARTIRPTTTIVLFENITRYHQTTFIRRPKNISKLYDNKSGNYNLSENTDSVKRFAGTQRHS